MEILFHCRCGRTLQIPGEFGGKQVRCPGCRSVLIAPRNVNSSGNKSENSSSSSSSSSTIFSHPPHPGKTSVKSSQPSDNRSLGHEKMECGSCHSKIDGRANYCKYCGTSQEQTGNADSKLNSEDDSGRGRKRKNLLNQRRHRGRPQNLRRESLPSDPNSILVFLLGVLGMIFWMMAPIFGPAAFILGNKHRRRVREGMCQKSTLAAVGWILGIFETLVSLAVVGLVMMLLF